MANGYADPAALQEAINRLLQAGINPATLASNPLSTNQNNQQSTEQLIQNRLQQMQLAGPLTQQQQAALTPTPQAAGSAVSAPTNYDDPATMLANLKSMRERLARDNPAYFRTEEASGVDGLIYNLEQGLKFGQDPVQILQAARNAMNQLQEFAGSGANDRLREVVGGINQQNLIPLERARETYEIQSQADKQKAEREALRKEMLGKLPGLRDQLGQDLLQQQNYAYSQIQPQIEQRLNAMGILQSGALPEAQARAFKDLENARQGRLADFSTQATQNLELGLPLESLYESQNQYKGALQGGIDLTRAGITRQFQESDLDKQYKLQRELSMQALEEARRARDQASATATKGAWIGAGSNILSGLLQGAGSAYGRSDSRLKTGIQKIDEVGGVGIYYFRWNEKARALGIKGDAIGVIAQDVEKKYPEAVSVIDDYLAVNYSLLPNKVIEAITWHSNYQRQ